MNETHLDGDEVSAARGYIGGVTCASHVLGVRVLSGHRTCWVLPPAGPPWRRQANKEIEQFCGGAVFAFFPFSSVSWCPCSRVPVSPAAPPRQSGVILCTRWYDAPHDPGVRHHRHHHDLSPIPTTCSFRTSPIRTISHLSVLATRPLRLQISPTIRPTCPRHRYPYSEFVLSG